MTKLEMVRLLQAQVCGSVNAHPENCLIKKQNGKLVMHQKSSKSIKLNSESFEFWLRKSIKDPSLLFNPFLLFSLGRTISKKSRHYQFSFVCAKHLEHWSLVLKNVRIIGI